MQLKRIINPSNKLLSDRCSIRSYDTSVKISRSEMADILQDALTAPSSFNLQPWRFAVIDTPEGKEKIKPFMLFNLQQCETSSAIIAVFGDYENLSCADAIYSSAVENQLMGEENKQKILSVIEDYRKDFTQERIKNVFLLDCGFVSMQIMLSAKAYGYDTNPIGGYMKKELTEALGYDTNRYFPVLLISIGKAAEKGHDSVRFSVDEITQWV